MYVNVSINFCVIHYQGVISFRKDQLKEQTRATGPRHAYALRLKLTWNKNVISIADNFVNINNPDVC